MLFTITPPGGGQPYVLADDSGPRTLPAGVNYQSGLSGYIKEGYTPRHDTRVQKTDLVRAANLFGAVRLNQSTTIRFTVDRGFSSVADLLAFLDDLPSLVPLKGEMTRTSNSRGQIQTRFLPLAFREVIDCTYHVGTNCKVNYQFWAPSAWQTAP